MPYFSYAFSKEIVLSINLNEDRSASMVAVHPFYQVRRNLFDSQHLMNELMHFFPE